MFKNLEVKIAYIMKLVPIHLCLLFLIASLFGCATPYQKVGIAGGFKESQQGRNSFDVAFGGNGYTTPERASELCLLRCAELTLTHGYRYFILINNKALVDRSTTVSSGSYGGGLMFAVSESIPKPVTRNSIVCFREKPTMYDTHFDAQKVFDDLASKYGVTKKPEHFAPFFTGRASLGIFMDGYEELKGGRRLTLISEESNAGSAGLKVGDYVKSVNGFAIKEEDKIRSDSANWQVGQQIEVSVKRGTQVLKFPVRTVFNNEGIVFKQVNDLGLSPLEVGSPMILEGTDISFSFIPVAEYSDYENPLESLEEFKQVAAFASNARGANVVHILRNPAEVKSYFANKESKAGFNCGLLYAPKATLGISFESGAGFEKRRVIRRISNTDAGQDGLRIGDNILAFNSVDILSEPAIYREMMKWKPGDTVRVSVARDGKKIEIPVKANANLIPQAASQVKK